MNSDRTATTEHVIGFEDAPPAGRPMDEVVAEVLLRKVIASCDPALTTNGLAIVVTVPAIWWTRSVADAWFRLSVKARGLTDDDLWAESVASTGRRENIPNYESGYYTIIKESVKGEKKGDGNDNVATILSSGRTIVGFASSRDQLPINLLRSVDLEISVPRLDWDTLSCAIETNTGEPPTDYLPGAVCSTILPEDLRLAERPRQGADGYIARLRRIMTPRTIAASGEVPYLDDLHGMPEAVSWGLTMAADLSAWRAGKLSWSEVDKGATLTGPPGTGKTTFARALAKTCERECQCEVLLVECSFSKWQAAGHLNDFLKAMHNDFSLASAETPSIIFIDEIDSFIDRATLEGQNAEYCRQCVNGLLKELDGIAACEGVVALGATNSVSVVDPAILRPGRMDRIIRVPLPDTSALIGIFRHYLRESMCTDGDLAKAASIAHGATGAQIEQLCRGARRRARQEGRTVTAGDLRSEILASRGPKPNRKDLRLVAVHEAGHVLVSSLDMPGSVNLVSLFDPSSTGGGGSTVIRYDSGVLTLDGLRMRLRLCLAGRAAEIVLLGRATTAAGGPAESDLAVATSLAVSTITSYCLATDETPIWLGPADAVWAAKIVTARPDVEKHVRIMLAEAHAEAVAIVTKWRRAVAAIARALRHAEILTGEEIKIIIRRHQPTEQRRQADTDIDEADAEGCICR